MATAPTAGHRSASGAVRPDPAVLKPAVRPDSPPSLLNKAGGRWKVVRRHAYAQRFPRFHCQQTSTPAVGVIIGLAFGKIVTTLVEGIIMPPIGMLLNDVDFSTSSSSGSDPGDSSNAQGGRRWRGSRYRLWPVHQRRPRFLIVAGAVFLRGEAGQSHQELHRQAPSRRSRQRRVPFCASTISIKATRCPNCTSSCKWVRPR